MSRHLALELLSSYVDDEVTPRQLRLVENHLDDCSDCRQRLEGLRSVAASVRRLESVAPPSTLGATLERRIRIAAQEEAGRTSLEKGLGRWLGQPVLAPIFAVVLALGAILYLFSYGLSVRMDPPTRVVVASLPDDAAAQETSAPGESGSVGATLEPGATAEARQSATQDTAGQAPPPASAGAPDSPQAALLSKEEPGGRGSVAQGDLDAGSAAAPGESDGAIVAFARKRIPAGDEQAAEAPARRRAAPAEDEPAATPPVEDGAAPVDDEKVVVASESPRLAEVEAEGRADARSSTRTLGGRTFLYVDGVWVESGVAGEPVAEIVDLSEVGVPADSELAAFSELGRVRLRFDTRVIEVVFPPRSDR